MGTNYLLARCALWRLIFYVFLSVLGPFAIFLFLHVHNGSKGVERPRGTSGRLIIGNGCFPGSSNQPQEAKYSSATNIAIYVLGGSQDSLRLKYHTAAVLCQRGVADQLIITSSEGITEYDQKLDRNLTNDEWTVRQLTNQGVKCGNIRLIMLQNGFFGTLREAETLKTICIDGGIKRLLLVCSAYHCKRVRSTFSGILEGTGVEIDIHATDEQVGLGGIFIEYLKLIFYENVLISLKLYFS